MQVTGKSHRVVAVALLATTALVAAARADTLDVPAEYPTIQVAIVAAQPGDIVLVAPGTYVETIDFLGKAITVESTGGAAVTTIDGNGAGSVVSFVSGETQASKLRGLTITGGVGTSTTLYPSYQIAIGGGIRIVSAGPAVHECVITHNVTSNYGGGVFVGSPPFGATAQATFISCVIANNKTTAPNPQDRGGGGITALNQALVTMTDCTLASNSSLGSGGGFYAAGRAGMNLTGVLIDGNSAAGVGGGGMYSSGQEFGYSLFMTNCTVTDNTAAGIGAEGFSGIGGGGLFLSTSAVKLGFPPSAWIQACLILGNSSPGDGGGIYANGTGFFAGVHVLSCLIADNSSALSGGGVLARGRTFLVGDTIVANDASHGGGLFSTNLSSGPRNCILWANVPDQLAGVSFTPTWCDIQGGVAGTGNIDVDPFFVDAANGDFHLAPTSACVDAGDPAFVAPIGETDVDGDPRVLFSRVDIGADEALFPKGPWTYLGHALPGAGGSPSLVGAGALTPGGETTLSLADAAASTASWLVAGAGTLMLPFKGGVMVPTMDMLVGPIGVGPAGSSVLSGRWPNDVPPGFVVTLQSWVADPTGPDGFTASNGLAAHSQ